MKDHETGCSPSFFPSQEEIIDSVFRNHLHPDPAVHEKVLYDKKVIRNYYGRKNEMRVL